MYYGEVMCEVEFLMFVCVVEVLLEISILLSRYSTSRLSMIYYKRGLSENVVFMGVGILFDMLMSVLYLMLLLSVKVLLLFLVLVVKLVLIMFIFIITLLSSTSALLLSRLDSLGLV